MNKETKIGLLVGLSFIVLFGVILNNRQDTASSERTLLNPQPRAQAPVPVRPLELPAPPSEHARAVPGVANLPAPTSIAFEAVTSTPPGPEAPLTDAGLSRGESTPLTASREPPRVTMPLVQMPEEPDSLAAATSEPEDATHDQSPAEPDVRTTIYIVQPGDSLAKIARLRLGGDSRENIDRLYEANKDKMPNRNTLAAGTKLQVPAQVVHKKDPNSEALVKTGLFEEVKRAGSHGEPADRPIPGQDEAKPAAKPVVAANDPTAPRRDDVTRYQVQKGDTWYRLAERFLGDGRRWKELQDLNKDVVPDPTKMRTGVKVRIPANLKGESAAAIKGQLASAS